MGIVTLKGGHMKVEFGLYKRVFIFNKIVIKIPKHSILEGLDYVSVEVCAEE